MCSCVKVGSFKVPLSFEPWSKDFWVPADSFCAVLPVTTWSRLLTGIVPFLEDGGALFFAGAGIWKRGLQADSSGTASHLEANDLVLGAERSSQA